LLASADGRVGSSAGSCIGPSRRYAVAGTVGGDRLKICDKIDTHVETLAGAHGDTLEKLVGGEVQTEELREG
jgi:hypothetical protein